MKKIHVILIVVLVLFLDQLLKFYVKTHFYLGEDHMIFPKWFHLHFVENEGMAYGWKFGGSFGKIILTLFRLCAVVWGVFLIKDFIDKKYHPGFIASTALIFAGAVGNLIDSMFYGLIFSDSHPFNRNLATLFPKGGGYAGFLYGRVVDMLHFPFISDVYYPSWFPVVGGEEFMFFEPVFNLADASISLGVFLILIFQNVFFQKTDNKVNSNGPKKENKSLVGE